jgi:hypothetical protein
VTHRSVIDGQPAQVRTSTTRTTLTRLQIGLLVGTAAVLVAALAVFELGHLTVLSASTKSAPAVLGVVAAQRELLQADDMAMHGFGSAYSPISTDTQYQNEITLAEANLERVAETNAAGLGGTDQLQLVSGLIVNYTSTLQRAAADYSNNKFTFGAAQAWAASEEMRKPDSGILNILGELRADEQRALQVKLRSSWVNQWMVLLWFLPAVALLVALVIAQRYLAVRFRRTVNWPLVGASVLLALLAAAAAFALTNDRQLATAGHGVDKVLAAQPATVHLSGLGAELAGDCRGQALPCGVTTKTFQLDLVATNSDTTPTSAESSLISDIDIATADANRAAVSDGIEFVIPGVAIVIAALIVLGLRPRIDEYRYRT